MSIVILMSIGLTKFYKPETFMAFTDISYLSPMQRGDGEVEHYRKGTNDVLFVIFFLNVVTVARYLYKNLVLHV